MPARLVCTTSYRRERPAQLAACALGPRMTVRVQELRTVNWPLSATAIKRDNLDRHPPRTQPLSPHFQPHLALVSALSGVALSAATVVTKSDEAYALMTLVSGFVVLAMALKTYLVDYPGFYASPSYSLLALTVQARRVARRHATAQTLHAQCPCCPFRV